MRFIGWMWKLAVFLALFAWSLQNLEPVNLHFFLGHALQAPLMVLLFLAFVIGAGFGLAAGIARNVRQRRLIVELRRRQRPRRRPGAPDRALEAS
jgi:uncharacterized integral membrane protein